MAAEQSGYGLGREAAEDAARRNARAAAPRPDASAPQTDPKAAAPSSLRQVVREYASYVVGLLGRLGVAPADVEDVAQEVYLALHEQMRGFEGRSSFKTWLCGICRHKAGDYRRKASRRRALRDAQPVEVSAPAESPQDQLLEKEGKELLRSALQRLPDEQLEVFVLYAVEEIPMKDVAAMVDCPIDTAYTRYRAARQRIEAHCRRAMRIAEVS